MSENKELLEVKDLGITFFTDRGALPAVQEVSFNIKPGETLGVVGESGCGKSMTALSLMQLIPSPPGKITAGEIMYKGEDLLKKSPKEMRDIRGKEISMIFQEPMTSLNPVITVGKQIMEAVLTHEKMSKQEAKERALEMIKLVGIPNAIMSEASLSFLGLGVKAPMASWGSMISFSQPYIRSATYYSVIPGLAIIITVLAFNMLGDGLRDALDPKLRS